MKPSTLSKGSVRTQEREGEGGVSVVSEFVGGEEGGREASGRVENRSIEHCLSTNGSGAYERVRALHRLCGEPTSRSGVRLL